MDIEQANATAVNRLMESRPILKSVATARDVIPGLRDNLLLHAGAGRRAAFSGWTPVGR